jgi:hypothetical protein
LSDIGLDFGWEAIVLLALIVGWPGMLFGVLAGALAWRRRRWLGALLGAVLGLVLWSGVQVAWR